MKIFFFQKYLDDNNLDYKNDSQDRIFLLQVKKKSIIKKSNNSNSLLAYVSSHTVFFVWTSKAHPTPHPPIHTTNQVPSGRGVISHSEGGPTLPRKYKHRL